MAGILEITTVDAFQPTLASPQTIRPLDKGESCGSLSLREKGRRVEFKTETGKGAGYLASPEKPRGGVLVLHAWWGLNDFFKGFCDRLAAHGFLALAPDLFGGAVAKSVSEAKKLASGADDEAVRRIVLGAANYLRSQPSQSGRKIGAVGFSFGAAWALLLSTLRPEEVGSVVVFYGTYPVDFSMAKASFLGHYSPEDEWEPAGEIRALEQKIRGAGREVSFHFYPGTKHWFFEEDQDGAYDREAAGLAWDRTLEFLNKQLA
jgi:carboxymethylenebutenolidase